MQTIRKKLSILFVTCSIIAILLIILFVNITINNKFDKYMIDIQNKRYEGIVSYFREVYRRDGKWTDSSGIELMHEAYMNNYCLALLDKNERYVWGMNPDNIRNNTHINTMFKSNKGIYNSKRFSIKLNGEVVGYVDIGQYSPILLSEDDVNFKKSINRSIIVSGIIALTVTAAISLYFSRQFSMPIREVANMSENFSKGNFNMKSDSESNIEELEILIKSINILGEKLKYQDMLRKRLISDISHEIRTPLNVLQNNLEAMMDNVLPITTDRLNCLNEEVIRFGKLLNNLDILKEFESEGIKLNFERTSLDELVKDVCKDFYMAAENKNIELYYNIEPDKDYIIMADKDKLKQVFINLISNALKFTKKDGKISIDLYSGNKNIIVKIKDNGIGIKKEDLPFIFERLYRGDRSRNQTVGNGIGLTVVKNILQLHSASIDVESEEGKGTVFSVFFNK